MKPMVIAIDGPAGAGKSTVTRAVSRALGILYLDTGAMYRAATVGLFASGVDVEDSPAVAAWCGQRTIDFDDSGSVWLDGVVVPEQQLRSPETTGQIWRIANNSDCRAHLVTLQQGIVAGRNVALEGRDATTVICPDAALKVYLDASPMERARRRLLDWSEGGDPPPIEDVAAGIAERDRRDSERDVGALTQASDAVPVHTDGMTPEQVVARIIALAVQRRPLLLEAIVADQVIVGRSRQAGYVSVAEGSVADPPRPWMLGLTNPSPDRLPGVPLELACNSGGRQAGTLCQGRAVLVLAGKGSEPGRPVALPILPQSWYVIEPGSWHAVVQEPGTVLAWAEASGIHERRQALSEADQAVAEVFIATYFGGSGAS